MKNILLLLLASLFTAILSANTLHVGSGQPYSSLSDAATDAEPGDTILFHSGVYSGGEFVADLQGTSFFAQIYLLAQSEGSVIIRGGTNAWQLSDAAYLHIEGLIFEQQTGNGFNMDDGGSYATPSHHITFYKCTFRDMNASGNNDLLKLSGLNDFIISNCDFINGSGGGSGIDMVGCHNGIIERNYFENMGSNGIQAKGGTQFIRIEKNFFKNCGQRSINLGGSTGLEFFRPIDATFEAADLQVYSNIFIGSMAPVAFVGCVRVNVINNTIITPEKWVFRILQETVDTDRFEPCGFNTFRNNIIYKNNNVSTDCNIGPDTAPETFTLSNNLWYNYQNAGNSDPNSLPVTDVDNIIGSDPLMNDPAQEDFVIPVNSPATGQGFNVPLPLRDYAGVLFSNPRSIGAFEGNPTTSGSNMINASVFFKVSPNPVIQAAVISWNDSKIASCDIELVDAKGTSLQSSKIENGGILNMENVGAGVYFIVMKSGGNVIGTKSVIKM